MGKRIIKHVKNSEKSIIAIHFIKQIVLIGIVLGAYVFLFKLFFSVYGIGIIVLSLIPVMLIAWYFGMLFGVFAAFLTFPLNVLLLNSVHQDGVVIVVSGIGFMGQVVIVFVAGIVGRLSDTRKITQNTLETLRRKEYELSAANERWNALIHNSPDFVMIADKRGKIKFINKKLPEMKEKGMVGSIIYAYMPKEYKQDAKKTLAYVFATGKSDSFETQVSSMDGRQAIYDVQVVPIKVEDKTSTLLLIARDTTKEREAEKIQNDFISVASHQMKSPLTSIGWQLEALLNDDFGALTAKQTEVVSDTLSANKMLLKLVYDMLHASRLESGNLKLESVPVQIEHVVESVIHDFEVITKKKECRVVLKKSGTIIPMLHIDQVMLRQVIDNLISNAVKYSLPNSCEIQVQIEKKENKVRVSVKDQGIGIPSEAKSKIFEKFYRGENAKNLEAEGSGLGLYIAKTVIERMGGTIGFTSQEGKGTTFWFELPIGSEPKRI